MLTSGSLPFCLFVCLFVYLFVLGILTLSGPQEVRATAGDTAVISCQYHSFYYDYIKYLCKGYYWYHCTVLIRTKDRTKDNLQITDDRGHLTFTITMTNVRIEDSGWYWCAIDRVSKHVKVAVLLTVTAGKSLHTGGREPDTIYYNTTSYTAKRIYMKVNCLNLVNLD